MKGIVGIIGGNGVAATNKLQELMEIRLTKNGAFRDAHHPEMIIYQATQAPSRSMFLEGRGESFITDYIEIGNKLKAAGADKIGICCNTAHFAIDEINEGCRGGVINIVRKTVLEAKDSGAKKFGLVASDGCVKCRVYDRYFQDDFPQGDIVYPNVATQALVTKGICNIKNAARFLDDDNPERPKNIFAEVCRRLREQGADKIIIGCTDVRVDYFDKNNIDSLETMVSYLLEDDIE